MAATYGYTGEFSSDEDIDRMEQTERLVQTKFDGYTQLRPTKHQIEEAIETIKNLPIDQDFNFNDELLAGLLDHYKTQRGPIVDSTRNLYKKIILRLIRSEQLQQQKANSIGDNSSKDNNGNININNNDDDISKKPLIEMGSSDEDEPMPPVSSQSSNDQDNRKKSNSRIVHHAPMEVDLETPLSRPQPAYRSSNLRPVDLNTESSDSADSETEESSEESTTDSEALDVTPIRLPTTQTSNQQPPKVPVAETVTPAGAVASAAASVPTTAKTSESMRKLTAAPRTALVVEGLDSKKKPYTRSQRIAANKISSTPAKGKKIDVTSSKSETVASNGVKPLSKSALTSLISQSRLITYCQGR